MMLGFKFQLLSNMSEKHKFTSPSAIEAKIWQKPIGIVGRVV